MTAVCSLEYRAIKNPQRILKVDVVLGEVGPALALVPLEKHSRPRTLWHENSRVCTECTYIGGGGWHGRAPAFPPFSRWRRRGSGRLLRPGGPGIWWRGLR